MIAIDILTPLGFSLWAILVVLMIFILNFLHLNNQFWYETIFIRPVYGPSRLRRKIFRNRNHMAVIILFAFILSISVTIDQFDVSFVGMGIGVFLFMAYSYTVIASGYRATFERLEGEGEP